MSTTHKRGRGRPRLNPSFRPVNPGSHKEHRKAIGQLVRRARREHGLSQEQAGAKTVTRAMVSAIENGKILPGIRTLRQLAANLKTSVRDLLPSDLRY